MPFSFPRLVIVARLAAVIALLGTFAACDRHPAGEVGRGYGHGSSHEKSFFRHTIDSSEGSAHFSDTRGTQDRKEPAAPAAASPQPASLQKRFTAGDSQ